MLIVLKGRLSNSSRHPIVANTGAQTVAGQLEEFSRLLWAGEMSKLEHDKLRDALLKVPTHGGRAVEPREADAGDDPAGPR